MKKEKFLGKTISKKDADKDSFEDVTNYKKERSYSEEEVKDIMKLGEDAFNKNVHEKLRETLSPTEKQMWINGYLLALTERN